MESHLKVLHLDASSGFYKIERFPVGEFFGPVDLGLYLSGKYNSLNIGTGIFAGSIFPGSNRLIFTGFSPCWGTFYISSMGGAGLVFDDLGINLLSIRNSSASPSILYLNRVHGEEIEVRICPVDINRIWESGRGGVYSLMDYTLETFGEKYINAPRVLSTGKASLATDIGAIVSAPVTDGKVSFVDTWAGRGGLGTKLLSRHGIASIIYGGTYLDEDFRDRKVADSWFENKFSKKMAAKDLESTKKYRFDPDFDTGGTLGVNFKKVGGSVIAFNYKSIYMNEEDRLDIHRKFILDHYLKQFNDETIKTKQMKTCGEPCAAVCKKMNNEFKKDFEPYQALGPLCGVFDQRAAEKITHHADMLGFDAISIGGTVSWLMECMSEKVITPGELGISGMPVFNAEGFSVETDSMHNADLGIAILDSIIEGKGLLNLKEGARSLAWRLSKDKGRKAVDLMVYNSNARRGWVVPNQYWTPGVLAPMPIMGKYYMYYGSDFYPPRELGRKCAERLIGELVLDNTGFCRFHRKWAEEITPDIIGSLYGMKDAFIEKNNITAGRINSRNSAIYWESERNIDFIYTFLKRKHETGDENSKELSDWVDSFKKDKKEAALNFWFEMYKGIHESLREF